MFRYMQHAARAATHGVHMQLFNVPQRTTYGVHATLVHSGKYKSEVICTKQIILSTNFPTCVSLAVIAHGPPESQ